MRHPISCTVVTRMRITAVPPGWCAWVISEAFCATVSTRQSRTSVMLSKSNSSFARREARPFGPVEALADCAVR